MAAIVASLFLGAKVRATNMKGPVAFGRAAFSTWRARWTGTRSSRDRAVSCGVLTLLGARPEVRFLRCRAAQRLWIYVVDCLFQSNPRVLIAEQRREEMPSHRNLQGVSSSVSRHGAAVGAEAVCPLKGLGDPEAHCRS